MTDKIIKELIKTINMLVIHKDNKPNSEFSERIDSLVSLRKKLRKRK